MEIDFIDVKKNNKRFTHKILKSIKSVIKSGNYILGKNLEEFELSFAKYCGTKYAVGVNSGTDALKYSLLASGVSTGNVATVSFTFPATVMSILSAGAIPQFIDIDPQTGLMSLEDLKRKINKDTKAIMPVHFMGHPCDMDDINKMSNHYGIPVIEDACQAVGSTYHGKRAGSLGDFGCFSFFPTKNLSCIGDGGAITTNDDKMYKRLLLLRNFGRKDREEFDSLGYNSRLDEVQAAVLNIKLPLLDYWNNIRNDSADYYNKNMVNGIVPVIPIADTKSAYHLYAVRVKDNKHFEKRMNEKGVDCRTHYSVPVHRHKFCKSFYETLHGTDLLSSQTLSLPLNENIKRREQDYVLKCLMECQNEL
jgi:dTDP-4-amino-4,6-dideoxygalactose transaminase